VIDDVRLDPFVEQLRHEAFHLDVAPTPAERIGAEVELIPLDAATGRPAPIESHEGPATQPVLMALGEQLGWTARRSAKAGVPEFRTPTGGRITFEPGGQLEYAAAPNESVSGLVNDLREIVAAMEDAMGASGIALVSAGIDPLNSIEDVPLLLTADRYRRMDRHFARIGPHGARMMRQTASMQICLDAGERPLERWRLLNSLAPYLVAMFANSPVYAGEVTGHQSARQHIWGTLDTSRTGIAYDAEDPVGGYARFGMQASAILLGDERLPCVPFAEHVRAGRAGMDEWRTHLTTLFPEVRPRGYFEVRSTDALEPQWYAAPLAFLTGLVRERRAARTADACLRACEPLSLARAGRCGLADERVAATTLLLADLAIDACESLGEPHIAARDVEVLRSFVERYTRRRRAPASDMVPIDARPSVAV
jgi:glutamate--cysteine ligase